MTRRRDPRDPRRENPDALIPERAPGHVAYGPDDVPPLHAPQPGEALRLTDGRVVYVVDCAAHTPASGAGHWVDLWEVGADPTLEGALAAARHRQAEHIHTWVVESPRATRHAYRWQEMYIPGRKRYEGYGR